MNCAAVVLAAGGSSRLGTPKQLVLHQGETLLERAVRIAQESGAQPVIVVLGAQADRLRVLVEKRAIVAINDDWQSGMSTSVRAGLQAALQAAPDVEGVLLLTCDQPAVTSAHLKMLMDGLETNKAAASFYANRRGVPAAFRRSQFAALRELKGDEGARRLLVGEDVAQIALADGDFDIDTPDDLTRL